jgi:hypothetical protein
MPSLMMPSLEQLTLCLQLALEVELAELELKTFGVWRGLLELEPLEC